MLWRSDLAKWIFNNIGIVIVLSVALPFMFGSTQIPNLATVGVYLVTYTLLVCVLLAILRLAEKLNEANRIFRSYVCSLGGAVFALCFALGIEILTGIKGLPLLAIIAFVQTPSLLTARTGDRAKELLTRHQ